jgi:hypothetical protein
MGCPDGMKKCGREVHSAEIEAGQKTSRRVPENHIIRDKEDTPIAKPLRSKCNTCKAERQQSPKGGIGRDSVCRSM